MEAYLINCEHEVFCQGYERVREDFLIYADSFERACDKLYNSLEDPRFFENKTIGFENKTIGLED